MDDEVELAPAFPQRLEHRVDRVEVLDVAGQHQLRADALGQRLDAFAQRFALVGEGELGAMRVQRARNAPGDRIVVGDAHDEAAAASHDVAHGPALKIRLGHASTCLKTSVALVPPKPKEFDSTARRFRSRRSRTMFMSAKSGSISSICALSQTKPEFIIRSE